MFVFYDKAGKEIGRGEGTSHGNAAIEAGIEEYFRFEEVEGPGTSTSETVKTEATAPEGKKVRKPRADKGQPRKGKSNADVTPATQPRKRPLTYHLVKGVIQTFGSKQELDTALKELPEFVDVKVVIGGTVKTPECEKTIALK